MHDQIHAVAYDAMVDAEERLVASLSVEDAEKVRAGLNRVHGAMTVLLGMIDGSYTVLEEFDRDGQVRSVLAVQRQIMLKIEDLTKCLDSSCLPLLMYQLAAISHVTTIARAAVDKILSSRRLSAVR